jgi:hypothetical protein
MPDHEIEYSPDAADIQTHAVAFAQMMFSHARFEREVRALQGTITREPAYGEEASNQFRNARNRPKDMAKLIKVHRGDGCPEAEAIVKVLCDAVEPCDQRNDLAHGEWWCFDRRSLAISVRSGTRRKDDQHPQHFEYTAPQIAAIGECFETLDAELFKLRRSVENQDE